MGEAENTAVEETAAVTETVTVGGAVDAQPQEERQLPFKEGGGYFWGTGRRKKSVARVRVKPGSGVYIVNGRPMEEFFPILRQQKLVQGPLEVSGLTGKVDVYANVRGGGVTGQTGAVMMGLARAITGVSADAEPALRSDGYLTRDSRMVERKKYGRRGARRSFQFSKR